MKVKEVHDHLQFLAGSEMGDLIRDKNWKNTSLGPPELWSPTFCSILSTVLHSKFPMILWWGPELLCFYNDAFRPSLGINGKHPYILGMPAADAWSEIWDKANGIEQILDGGKPMWNEDEPIAIFRNGKIEDVYLTYSCSPVYDDGKITGVLGVGIETTDKISVNNKLKESKDELQFAIDAAELGTWDYNPFTNKFSANKRLKDWFGLPDIEQIQLQRAIDVLIEEDRIRVLRNLQEALTFSSGGKFDVEVTVVHPVTGNKRILHTKGKVWFNENKIAYRFNGTMEDVTEERLNEKKIEKSYREVEQARKKLDIVIEASGLGTFELNIKTDVVVYSQRCREIFGYYEDEKPDHTDLIHRIHPDDIALRNHAYKTAMETGILYYQSRIIHPDNSVHWMEIKGKVFYDDRHEPELLMGTIRDITDEKRYTYDKEVFALELEKKVKQRTKELLELNQSLKQSEERYHLMVEEVQDYAIFYLNREGVIENWNNGVEKIKGYKANEIVGKCFSIFYTKEDRENNVPEKLLEQAVEYGRVTSQGWRLRKDGTLFWANVVITAVHNDKGEVTGFSKVTHDLTEKKEAEDQLKKYSIELEQRNEDLKKINKELESFAYISSHDLQEPLRKIQAFASRLLEKEYDNLSENGKDYFNRMQKAAERMQKLIEDLLAYSRTNNSDRKFEKTDLNVLLQEVKSDLKEELQHKNAIIESGKLCEINIIPFQFRQLLHNLIGNSLKFSKQGEVPRIQIKSECTTNEHHVKFCHVSISDNGIGFEQEYHQKIFELFQRLHAKTEYSGTGIGLAIVKKIVDNHNGTISVQSEPGKGTTFNIYIPVS